MPAWAQNCALRMPLLHTVRGTRVLLSGIVESGALKVMHEQKQAATVASETGLAEPPSVYFFAGRACPTPIGSTVFWISADGETGCAGKVSPFDTGGVMVGKSTLPWQNVPPRTQTGYVQQHTEPIGHLREYLGRHLCSFFDSAGQYWTGVPSRAIDGRQMTAASEWHDWTFEIRIETDFPVVKTRAYITRDVGTFIAGMARGGRFFSPTETVYTDLPAELAENDARALAAE